VLSFFFNVLHKGMFTWASPGHGRSATLYRKMRMFSAKQFTDVRRGQNVKPHSTTTEHIKLLQLISTLL
jgi:hypothetical protein